MSLDNGSSAHDSVSCGGKSFNEHSTQFNENISNENVDDVSVEDHVINDEGCNNNNDRNGQIVEPEDKFDYHEPVHEGAPISFNQSMLLMLNLSLKRSLTDIYVSDIFSIIKSHCLP
ncbi:hypothetical protein PV325_006001 [Microctonus aethiopoides]|uniref:Uncharacterized protein n=1 Tax=Microctonus aethiopoides TaxID=144406 RepID=A0AA39FA55_9HYME|nr:hypothetical protein PV325_006001 [Microctonus aethiopoides]KAK0081932.1 hypothetical protein PV326_007432 [Microctonus aethiopoides]KAK0165649.1 hypothetical protein PV328_004151 [Microctonus aethiopoides]